MGGVSRDDLKRQAAERAAGLIEDGMRVGLGTGSTARFVLEAMAARRAAGDLSRIVGVPTSTDTRERALGLGIPLASLDDVMTVDLTIDGADEVAPDLDVIKGLGGSLLWEKIVASVSKRLVIVVDDGKLVGRLGQMAPVPVEIVPFGWRTRLGPLTDLGAVPSLRAGGDGAPFLTDGGHYIVDCRFPSGIEDPPALERALQAVPGVVDTGLFLGMVETVVVAGADGVHLRQRSVPA